MSGAYRADLPKSPPDFRILRGETAWIEDVVVDAAARGRGIGEALVREALALACREGVARVMLTSNATRRAAHRLYERMGFVRYETDCFRLDL